MSKLLSSLGQDAGKQCQVQYQTLFKWQRVIFTLTLIDDELTIKVEDEGISFNPLTVKNPEMVDDLNIIQIGGFGVYIVKELMDDICYRRYRGKNHLTLKKFIRDEKLT